MLGYLDSKQSIGTAKLIVIWWCLFAFIACGYEHSVANMTLFALLRFYTLLGIGHNLLWVSLSNIVASVAFMGLGYWYSTPKAERPQLTANHTE